MLTKLRSLSGRRLYYTVNFVAGIAIFFFGYDQGMMGGVNTAPDYVETMKLGYSTYEGPDEGYVVTITEPTRQGGIVSIYYLGTLIGCLMGGILGDRVGRLKTMLLGGLWVMFGAALQCSAQNIAWMLCARIINGIGTGYLNAVVPVWSAEVSTHTSRGAFIALEFTLNIFGVVVAYWLEFGLGYIGDGRTQFRWRFPIAFQIIPVVIFMLCLSFMPESPRWLVKVGRTEEARDILGRLREGSGGPEETARADAEFEDIMEIVNLEKKHSKRNSYWAMFWGIDSGDLHVARRVQLSVWLQIVQEWVGIAAITVYAPTIFAEAGYSSRKSQWLSGLNDVTYMLATLMAVVTIDRWGRRVGLWWGAVGQGISLILAGAFSRLLKDHPENASQYGGAAAFFVFLYTAIFGATWLSIPWVYPTETFPLEVRAKGNAWGVVGWSIGNGWLTLLNPVMFNAIQENTLHIFGAVNFLSIPMVWALYPETANRTLEEMDLLFASKSPWVWDEEAHFKKLKEANPQVEHTHALEGKTAATAAHIDSKVDGDEKQ
ncbi:general substrate transporter [Gloeophyllum trabeum ATCC 11539]|uniref:General substrate transporter n=1 Tax=Gloeophyllum trabeum (strain ATCC 11539 / FP-39264 / Madison 617) TaxID=670483 RepID=S7RNF3_GLOTA|nr:general substrate transporter [Gloeophyllum trabeum ATCC 11539]EPQ55990.1 general substrate transporter [Gloeophyllum trabeum ATCC 11539]